MAAAPLSRCTSRISSSDAGRKHCWSLVMVSEVIQPEPGLLVLTQVPPYGTSVNLKQSATISPVLFYCTLPFWVSKPGKEAREWNIPGDIPMRKLIKKPPGHLQGGSRRARVKAGRSRTSHSEASAQFWWTGTRTLSSGSDPSGLVICRHLWCDKVISGHWEGKHSWVAGEQAPGSILLSEKDLAKPEAFGILFFL